jgi:hypothetical protein
VAVFGGPYIVRDVSPLDETTFFGDFWPPLLFSEPRRLDVPGLVEEGPYIELVLFEETLSDPRLPGGLASEAAEPPSDARRRGLASEAAEPPSDARRRGLASEPSDTRLRGLASEVTEPRDPRLRGLASEVTEPRLRAFIAS